MDLRNLLIFIFFITMPLAQNITLQTAAGSTPIAVDGVVLTQFHQQHKQMDCGMPQLYIFDDYSHSFYHIQSVGSTINSVKSVWGSVEDSIICTDDPKKCTVSLNNQCSPTQSSQIGWIKIQSSIGQFQFLTNCNPDKFYKPFQWGLLLLIMLSTVVLTLSSVYSRAWSYGGIGYQITNKSIVIFNLCLTLFIGLAYSFPDTISLASRIFGSIIGALGVGVCVSQLIWLTHNKNYQKKVFKKLRIIDIVSFSIGIVFIPLYWIFNGQWIINDIMAVCSTVALMKLMKIKSLSIAINLLASLLVLEIIVGIFVHYVFKISYNNYIINLFQNPVMLVMPSITKELYRRCAWLPITAILFPGLVLSYLRRFDKTRGTYLYFIIGLISFYAGSVLWMVIDLETVHSLPFAIISEPITIVIVLIYSTRRNQLKTLWRGNFHDEQLYESQAVILQKQTQISGTPSAYADLTDNLRVSLDASSTYEPIRISEQLKL